MKIESERSDSRFVVCFDMNVPIRASIASGTQGREQKKLKKTSLSRTGFNLNCYHPIRFF